MTGTPVGDRGEAFGVVDALLGVSPFVFLAGLLAGLVAALAVWPVAARFGPAPDPLETAPSEYLRGPLLVGGVGLLASVAIDVARESVPDGAGPALAVRLLVVGGALSAVAHRLQYGDDPPGRRRANGYAYAAFAVAWTALALGLYACWTALRT